MRFFALLLLAAACTPPVAPPNPPDASDASPPPPDAAVPPGPPASAVCVQACAAIASAGCSEGRSATCAVSMTKIDADRLIRGGNGQSITCSACATAKTAADVAAVCGSSCSP